MSRNYHTLSTCIKHDFCKFLRRHPQNRAPARGEIPNFPKPLCETINSFEIRRRDQNMISSPSAVFRINTRNFLSQYEHRKLLRRAVFQNKKTFQIGRNQFFFEFSQILRMRKIACANHVYPLHFRRLYQPFRREILARRARVFGMDVEVGYKTHKVQSYLRYPYSLCFIFSTSSRNRSSDSSMPPILSHAYITVV